jgi:hypothetical protein
MMEKYKCVVNGRDELSVGLCPDGLLFKTPGEGAVLDMDGLAKLVVDINLHMTHGMAGCFCKAFPDEPCIKTPACTTVDGSGCDL